MVAKKSTNSRVTPPKKGTPAASEPTSVNEWKSNSVAVGALIRVPSGKTARVRRVGMQTLVARGMIPNSLIGFIKDALAKGKPGKVEDMDLNPQTISDMLALVNMVTIDCVIEPKVYGTPPEGVERDPDKLYVDEIDETDKMFIFNYTVGGTTDIESFRKELASDVGPV